MRLGGAGTDEEGGGDFGAGFAFRSQLQNHALAIGQRIVNIEFGGAGMLDVTGQGAFGQDGA